MAYNSIMLDFSIPEHLDDIPPPYAAQMAHCREQALAWLAAHDYQLVAPPLVDYLETLTGGDEDLNLHTFKITDTLSGRTLGIRADQTPQIARFDASVNQDDASTRQQDKVRRYCYCGPTLRTRPPSQWRGRESMQLGAELFGAPAGGGDWEIASVALGTLRAMGVTDFCIDLGHAGLFNDLTASLAQTMRQKLLALVTRRDGAAIEALVASGAISATIGQALLILVQTSGSQEVLTTATAALPAAAEAALKTLAFVSCQLTEEQYDCAISLSDLGSYGYHSGVVFSIYAQDRLLARGGRYQQNAGADGVGFSLDLRAVYELTQPLAPPAVVNVPLQVADENWRQAVAALRAAGRHLRFYYNDNPEEAVPLPALCCHQGKWSIKE